MSNRICMRWVLRPCCMPRQHQHHRNWGFQRFAMPVQPRVRSQQKLRPLHRRILLCLKRHSRFLPSRQLLSNRLLIPNALCQRILLKLPRRGSLLNMHNLCLWLQGNRPLHPHLLPRMCPVHWGAGQHDLFAYMRMGLRWRIPTPRKIVHRLRCWLLVQRRRDEPVPFEQLCFIPLLLPGQLHLQPRLYHRFRRLRRVHCRRDLPWWRGSVGSDDFGTAARRGGADHDCAAVHPSVKESGVPAAIGSCELCKAQGQRSLQHHRRHPPGLQEGRVGVGNLLHRVRRISKVRVNGLGGSEASDHWGQVHV